MTKVDVAIKYILLKIQSGEYKEGDKLHSSRGLMYRFGLSKASSEETYKKLIASGIIYSKPRKGFFVSSYEKGLYETKTTKYKNNTKTYIDESLKLSKYDIANLSSISKRKITNEDYVPIVKEYYRDNQIVNIIIVFTKKILVDENACDYINEGIYKFLSYNGCAIISKKYFIDNKSVKYNNLKKIMDDEIHYQHSEVLIDYDKEIPLIIKTHDLDDQNATHQVFSKEILV